MKNNQCTKAPTEFSFTVFVYVHIIPQSIQNSLAVNSSDSLNLPLFITDWVPMFYLWRLYLFKYGWCNCFI